jgi:hypothetical protein
MYDGYFLAEYIYLALTMESNTKTRYKEICIKHFTRKYIPNIYKHDYSINMKTSNKKGNIRQSTIKKVNIRKSLIRKVTFARH